MNKKFFVSLAVILFAVFSFTVCFATDGNDLETATNDVRNFVGGAENTVENAALDISNTSKNVTGGFENGIDKDTNTMGLTRDTNNGKYSTARTATDNIATGMTSTTWTWLIIGIAAIAIIALIWYYSMQFANNNNHHNDND